MSKIFKIIEKKVTKNTRRISIPSWASLRAHHQTHPKDHHLTYLRDHQYPHHYHHHPATH